MNQRVFGLDEVLPPAAAEAVIPLAVLDGFLRDEVGVLSDVSLDCVGEDLSRSGIFLGGGFEQRHRCLSPLNE